MSRATLYIDHDPGRTEKGNAVFLAAVAYPLPNGREKANRFRAALLGWYYREKAADSEWRWAPQFIEPGYLLSDPEKDAAQLKKGFGFIEKRRMPAVELATLLMVDKSIPVDFNGERASLNKGAAFFGKRLTETNDPEQAAVNFKSRHWSTSKPAIHMAMALRQCVDLDVLLGGGPAPLLSGEWLVEAARVANRMADRIEQGPHALDGFPAGYLPRVELRSVRTGPKAAA